MRTIGCTKISMEEKSRAIALLDWGMSVIHVATDLKVSRQTIYCVWDAVGTAGRTDYRTQGVEMLSPPGKPEAVLDTCQLI